nr:heme lyase CcmF/NrfE family subunit [Chloroflexota bacterium]
MILTLGLTSLLLTFLCTLYATGAALISVRARRPALLESARNASMLTWPLLTLSSLSIIALLVLGHFEVEYVSKASSLAMPWYLKVTALWGGQAGSLLFWSWLMSAFTSAAMLRRWDRDRSLMPYVIAVLMVTLGFFLVLSIFIENPFRQLWSSNTTGEVISALFQPKGYNLYFPPDGNGLNPLLRHPGMIIHPPMLYLGFVSFVIPYAFAIAALVTRRTDDEWIRTTRRWTLIGWLFLSLGLILGGRWAYDVLGWGGYWGWDPVEIAAFMPWLTGTAFLHSVMIQEKRGMLKHWNMVLIILTYALVIFGTFLTRSGVLSSVHAFAQSAIGPLFFVFIGVTFTGSLALLLRRWSSLKSEDQLDSLLSRESLFLVNNLLFMGILVACFWGVIFPLVSEVFTGQKVTVGPPFYEKTTGPLFAGLLFLMGVAPLAAWRHTTAKSLGRAIWKPSAATGLWLLALLLAGVRRPGALLGFGLAGFVACVTLYEFWRGARARQRSVGGNPLSALIGLAGRNRRRYGGYIIHLGVVLMAIGIVGIELFQTETQGTIAQGETLVLGPYTLRFDSLSEFDAPDGRNVARAVVSVFKDGRYVGELYPRRDFYYATQQPMTIPGVRSTLEEDFYVLLVGWQPIAADGATFKIYLNPLVNLMWLGALVFIAGTLVAAWPETEVSRVTYQVPRPAPGSLRT